MPPSPESTWHGDQQYDVETVVFVHGILGDKADTWGEFPKLIDSDEDLPLLDILCWGYRSGAVPGSYQDVETEGDALVADLESHISEGNHVHLVGHSMGGLVILKGLVNRIRNEHGHSHPVTAVQWISLFATPLLGSAVANVVNFAIRSNKYTRLISRWLPSKQLRDLRRGEFVDSLLGDTVDLIYRPSADSLLVNCATPVRACYGKHDAIVSKESAIGVFRSTLPPKPLEGDHGSVKLPTHHNDSRYLALKKDLERALIPSFSQLCRCVLRDPSEQARRRAAERFDRQYALMLERCAEACFPSGSLTDEDRQAVAARIWEYGEQGDSTPAKTMTDVVIDFTYRDDARL